MNCCKHHYKRLISIVENTTSLILQCMRKMFCFSAVIMTPTRELALQITKECKKFSKTLGLRVVCVYGGTGISEQVCRTHAWLVKECLGFIIQCFFCSKVSCFFFSIDPVHLQSSLWIFSVRMVVMQKALHVI